MALDGVEVAVTIVVALVATYLSFHLLGWQAVLLIMAIASSICYLLARRWGKLREKGSDTPIQDS
jgi:membrane protein implicated in regulation of membrane protease activity